MAKKTHSPKDQHHRNVVGGVLALALSLVVAVAAQVGGTDTSKFSAQTTGGWQDCSTMGSGYWWDSMSSSCKPPSGGSGWSGGSGGSGGAWQDCSTMGSGYWYDSMTQSCKPPSGGGSGSGSNTVTNISCNVLNGDMVTPEICRAADERKNSCTSPSVWNGSNGGTCTAAATAPNCTSPQYLDTTTNTCKSPVNTQSCPSGQGWDTFTNMCKGTATGGNMASTYVTEPTCTGAPAYYFWSTKTGKCYSTMAEKTAADGGTTSYNCPSGQWWDYMSNTCKSSNTNTCSGVQYWDTATNMCKGSNYTVDTVDACKNRKGSDGRYGVWYPESSSCSVPMGSTSTGTQNWPTKRVVWNSLGVESMVCDNAPQAEIDARKLVVKDLKMSDVSWLNSNDCNKVSPDRARFPSKKDGSSNAVTTTSYPAGSCPDGKTSYPAGFGTPPCPSYNWTNNGAGQNTTKDSCEKSGYFWGTNSRWCYNTRLEMDNGEKYSNNNINTYTPTEAEKKICLSYTGNTWDPAKNPPCQSTTSREGHEENNFNNNWQIGKEPYSFRNDPDGCNKNGYYYDEKARDCFPQKPMPYGDWNYGNMGDPNMRPEDTRWTGFDKPMDCGKDAYFDQRMNSCQRMPTAVRFDDFKDNFTGDFQCQAWDMRCQEMQNRGNFDDGQFFDESQFNFNEAPRMSARDAKREFTNIKKEIKDLERNLKTMDLRQVNDLPIVAEGLGYVDQARAYLQEYESDSTNADAVSKARQMLSKIHDPEFGFWDSINQARQIADFRRELSFILNEIDQEQERFSYIGVESDEVSGYFERASAAVEKLRANPPYDPYDPQALWDSMSPECLRFGGGGGGFPGPMPMMPNFDGGGFADDFGGGMYGPQNYRMCSLDEALEGGTPRGYLEAARMAMEELEHSKFADNFCADAEQGVGEFRAMMSKAPAGILGEAEIILAEADRLLAACEKSEDKYSLMPAFDKLRMKAERLMKKAGFEDFEDPRAGFQMSGVDKLLNEDLINRIVAMVEQKVNETFNKLIEEKLSALATKIDDQVLTSITTLIGNLQQEIADNLTRTLDIASVLPKESREAVNSQQESVSNILGSLATIESVSEDAAERVATLRAAVAENPLPIEVLTEVETATDQALILAQNGEDPTAELQRVEVFIRDLDEEDLIRELHAEGLGSSFLDVKPSDWYYVAATEAEALGVATGTPRKGEEGFSDLRPGVPLNCAEGITMIGKALGMEPSEELSSEVRALAGSVDFAAPYFEAIGDRIGVETLRKAIKDCGGMGGQMRRDNFANVAVRLCEDVKEEEIFADDEEIAGYEDKDKMNDQQREVFAKAHAAGIITGADNGRLANFEGFSLRAEAAKMLSVAHKECKAPVDFPTPSGGLEEDDRPTI